MKTNFIIKRHPSYSKYSAVYDVKRKKFICSGGSKIIISYPNTQKYRLIPVVKFCEKYYTEKGQPL